MMILLALLCLLLVPQALIHGAEVSRRIGIYLDERRRDGESVWRTNKSTNAVNVSTFRRRSLARVLGFVGAFALVFLLPSLAFAAPPPDPLADPGGFAQWLYAALHSKAWLPFVGGLLIALMNLAKWQKLRLTKLVPWFATRAGGWALLLILSTLLEFGVALGAGHKLSLALVWAALGNGIIAAGGWEALKDLGKQPVPATPPASPPTAPGA